MASVMGNELESLRLGFGVQSGEFQFGAPLFELRGAAIHPGFTVGEHSVDEHRQVSGHGLDRRRMGGQLLAQMPIPASQVTLAV